MGDSNRMFANAGVKLGHDSIPLAENTIIKTPSVASGFGKALVTSLLWLESSLVGPSLDVALRVAASPLPCYCQENRKRFPVPNFACRNHKALPKTLANSKKATSPFKGLGYPQRLLSLRTHPSDRGRQATMSPRIISTGERLDLGVTKPLKFRKCIIYAKYT